MVIKRTRRRSKTNGRIKTTTTTSKKGISRSYSSKKPSGTRVTMKNGKQTMTWTDAAGYRVTSSTSSKKYRPKKNKPLFTSSSRRSSSGSDDDYDYDDEYTNDPRNSLWHTHGKFYTIIGGIILLFWILSLVL
jgi:hypothetical protein